MPGLMLGSLRALWPWQDDNAGLLAPGDNALAVFGMTLIGAAVVAAFIVADRVSTARRDSEVVAESQPA